MVPEQPKVGAARRRITATANGSRKTLRNRIAARTWNRSGCSIVASRRSRSWFRSAIRNFQAAPAIATALEPGLGLDPPALARSSRCEAVILHTLPARMRITRAHGGGWPVGIAGSAAHLVTRGALCPLAFGAHQLNWHPKRLRAVRHHGNPAS
jgi:hypothetical protein